MWSRWFKNALRPNPLFTDPAKLRLLLSRLVFIRVSILTTLLGTSAWNLLSRPGFTNTTLIFGTIAVTYSISLINILAIKRSNRLLHVGYIQLFCDILLASVAIYITGATESPFLFLYLVAILSAALVLNREGAVIIAALSGLAYSIIVSDLLPDIGAPRGVVTPQHILSVYLSLVLIALAAAYVARQLEILWGVTVEQERNLYELSLQQRQLFDDLSEGIITVNLDGHTTSINRAGRALLGMSQDEADVLVHKPLMNLLVFQGIGESHNLFTNHQEGVAREICFLNKQSQSEVCMSYVVRTLTDSAGTTIGKIILFNDVSHVRVMERRLSLHEEMTKLLAQEDSSTNTPASERRVQMIGESTVMKQVLNLVDRVAASEASVLIYGESGTGKELIARAIHYGSPRSSKPFVAINCGAIPESLIESELFGHKKGSFTGAISDKPGLFRQANGGTIFLDEIGELHPLMQTKLLRVLQEKSIRPVGDVIDIQVDVRVISATNRELKKEISAGGFREDLFYRLNVVNITVPPLRDRREDIPQLVRYFVGKYSDPKKVLPQISPEALELLSCYHYPGNIRELENVVERALVLGGQAILADHLPDEVRQNSRSNSARSSSSAPTDILTLPLDLESELSKLEVNYLQKALAATGGAKKQAAELLGLNFRSFRYRLKKYGMGDDTLQD